MSVEFVENRWEDSEIERFEGVSSEELHFHDRIEVGFVDEGPLVVEGAKWRQVVDSGCAYVLGAGLVHRLAERRPSSRLHRMYLGPRARTRVVPAPLVEAAARQPLLLPRVTAQSWWRHLSEGCCPVRVEPAPLPPPQSLHPPVARAVGHLRANLNRTVSLDELGTICRISKFHLCRVFHRTMGVTPRTYHRHIRLEASRGLLEKGRPSVLVANDLSFSDQSHFIRSFRKQFGMTPGDYVRALQVRSAGASAPAACG